MTESTFESAFSDVVEDIFGWDVEVTDEDGPSTVGTWDSLVNIRLVHALETRFDVRLPDTALLEEQTAGSLKQLVRELAAVS